MSINELSNANYKIGEIYWVNLKGNGHVQNGWHPAIIMQNNVGNKFSDTILVVPLTSKSKSKLPTHIKFKAGSFGLIRDSIAQCEGQRPIDKSDIGGYIGRLNNKAISEVAKGCLINTPYLYFLNEIDIEEIRNVNIKLN